MLYRHEGGARKLFCVVLERVLFCFFDLDFLLDFGYAGLLGILSV